jgi:glyoxylase-like metal-dependent hydrolase (beta-lactamase superfamily II)
MIQEVVTDLYKIVIPLPAALLGSVNSYLIKGPDRNLLVDTGLNVEKCRESMLESLGRLSVDLKKTDFFITHHHADHLGMLSALARDGSIVYINRSDFLSIEKMVSDEALDELRKFLIMSDFPEHDPRRLMPSDAADNYRMPPNSSLRFVAGGDELIIGDFQLLCLHTPGHTKGHMCLYEPKKKVFISGDHLLGDITPSIQLRNDTDNPLDAYLKALENLGQLNVQLVLPGHRSNFDNFQDRIAQLKAHHKNRENEVLAALADGCKTIYGIASQITWNIAECNGWNTVSTLQKLFATGEAMAHLKYLQEKGRIQRQVRESVIVYSVNS